MKPLAPNVVDNADRNPLGTAILSGGLGGQVLMSKPKKSVFSGQRKKTLMEAVQDEVSGIVDLSNVSVQPFIRAPNLYPTPVLKNIHEIVMDIEDQVIDRVIARQNGTPCDGNHLSGGQKQALFNALKRVIARAITGEQPIIGITTDPSGSAADRPAGSLATK